MKKWRRTLNWFKDVRNVSSKKLCNKEENLVENGRICLIEKKKLSEFFRRVLLGTKNLKQL